MRDDSHDSVARNGNINTRIPNHAAGHTARAGVVLIFVRKCNARNELRGEYETAGCNDALQNIATANVLEYWSIEKLFGFHLTPPSQQF